MTLSDKASLVLIGGVNDGACVIIFASGAVLMVLVEVSRSIEPCPVKSHSGEYEGKFSQISSNHLDCMSVPLAIALEMTPLLAPMARSIAPIVIPSESAIILIRDKILHMARKFLS